MNTRLLIDKVRLLQGVANAQEAYQFMVNKRLSYLRYSLSRDLTNTVGFAQQLIQLPIQPWKADQYQAVYFNTAVTLPKIMFYKGAHLVLDVFISEDVPTAYVPAAVIKNAGRIGVNRDTVFYTILDNRILLKFPRATKHLAGITKIDATVVLEDPSDIGNVVATSKKPYTAEQFIDIYSEFPVPSEFISFLDGSSNGRPIDEGTPQGGQE